MLQKALRIRLQVKNGMFKSAAQTEIIYYQALKMNLKTPKGKKETVDYSKLCTKHSWLIDVEESQH